MINSNKKLNKRNCEEIVNLHLELLSSSLISLIGKSVAKSYYKFIANSKKDYLFFVFKDSVVIGVCVLSTEPNTLMKRFLFNNLFSIGCYVFKSLLSSKEHRKRILSLLIKNGNGIPEIDGLFEVVQIFTNPRLRDYKIGSNLIVQVEKFLLTENEQKYFLKTFASDANHALPFYNKRGFKNVGKRGVGNRDYLYFIKNIN